MVQGRQVPWAGWTEWTAVRVGLFSPDRAARADAFDQIVAWRCRGRVPLGIEITSALLECRHRDPYYDQNAGREDVAASEMQLRLQYSMTLVRMVNGISDSSQKGRIAASVLSLASSAGLPRLLVDIRHEAAHNELPTLALLRLGADQALAWLQQNYWERQAQNLITSRERVANLVKEFVDSLAAVESKRVQGSKSMQSDETEPQKANGSTAGTPAGGEVARKPRSFIGELSEMAPCSSPELLADPLLDNGLLQSAISEWAAQKRSSATPKATLAHVTLQQLSQAFPQLRAALLGRAVLRIICLDASGAAQAGDQTTKDRLAILLDWVALLLEPKAAQKQGQKGKSAGKRKAGAEVALAGEDQWQPSTTQAKQLLADCLRASTTALPDGLDVLRQKALQQVSEQLRLFLPVQAQTVEGGTGVAAEHSLEAQGRESSAAESISQLRDAAQAELAAQAALLEQAARKKGDGVGSEQNKPGRWKKVQRWLPCAMGNLPSVQDSNGRASVLSSEQEPALIAWEPDDLPNVV